MMGGRELSCTALDDSLAVSGLAKTEKFKFRFLMDYVRHVKKSRVDPFRKEIWSLAMNPLQLPSEVFDIALHPTRPLVVTALLSGHVSWYCPFD